MNFALPPFIAAERVGRALALAAWRTQKPPQAISLDPSLPPAIVAAARRHLVNLGYDLRPDASWRMAATDGGPEWDGFSRKDNPFLWPAQQAQALPAVQIRDLDRRAIEEHGIDGLCLMENAGIGATVVAAEMCGASPVILVGPGNNGGDALVVARGLLCRGISVRILVLGAPEKLRGDAAANLAILQAGGVRVERLRLSEHCQALAQGSLIIDGLFGTGLSRSLDSEAAEIIAAVNACGKPVLALDLPSGLHPDTGEIMGAAIKARWTVTFAAPKKGFWLAQGPAHCGEVVTADIGFRLGIPAAG